jgi:molecular chaperone DnaK
VLESGDVNELKTKTDALQQAWTEAAQALYAQASAQPTGGGNGAADDSAVSDDEVVEDAEYEVVDDK